MTLTTWWVIRNEKGHYLSETSRRPECQEQMTRRWAIEKREAIHFINIADAQKTANREFQIYETVLITFEQVT